MSPRATEVLNRLGTFNRLPDGPWRMHDADVAHGENPSLDDSGWAVAKSGTDYPATGIWFRRWIEVPQTLNGYDLTGVRIWFLLQAQARHGSLNEIVYFNGRRVAMGESLEQLVLFENAKPGDRILVAVKVLRTTEDVHFDGSTERIDFAQNRPSPEDLRSEFLSLTRTCAEPVEPALNRLGDPYGRDSAGGPGRIGCGRSVTL